MQSVGGIFYSLFDKHKNKIAFINNKTGAKISYHDIKIQLNKVLQLFQEFSKDNHNNIILYMKPQPLFHVIDFGAMLSGNVSVLCDYTYNFFDMKFIIKDTDSKIVFTDNSNFVKDLANESNEKKTIFFYG